MIRNDTIWHVFGVIGMICTIGVIGMIACFVFDGIRNLAHVQRYTYQYKHRFDKPPTAACYCKDCVHHGKNGNDYSEVCNLSGENRQFTPFDGFCYKAEPMSWREAEKRGKDD